MICSTTSILGYEEVEHSWHIGDSCAKKYMNEQYKNIVEIQADGDELERCCAILGRRLPPNSVYTFLGNNAQEIAKNWR